MGMSLDSTTIPALVNISNIRSLPTGHRDVGNEHFVVHALGLPRGSFLIKKHLNSRLKALSRNSMGAWGTALCSDDTACDVRDGYRDLVGEGLSGAEATDSLMREWAESLDDPDCAPVFWLALAATQWRCGRLEPRVQKKALEVIDVGADLRKWHENAKLVKKRSAVLSKLREQLQSAQPAERRIPKRYRNSCEWEIGEVVSYHLKSGQFVLFQVIDFHSDKGGTSPICHLLDWAGGEIPSAEAFEKLGVKVRPWDSRFMLGRLKEKDLPIDRVRRLGLKLKLEQEKTPRAYKIFLWSYLDRQLKDVYGIE
jgi:hypothetical protein